MTWAELFEILKRDYRPPEIWKRVKTWRPSMLEIAAIILTVATTAWYLWYYNWNWRAWLFAIATLVCGYMMGDIVARIWQR